MKFNFTFSLPAWMKVSFIGLLLNLIVVSLSHAQPCGTTGGTVSNDTAICKGGSAQVRITGVTGTGNLTYQWQDSSVNTEIGRAHV